MADRRENSLLVSLKELRNLEEDRVREEEESVRAREDAEARAKEDAIRRVKEAEEAKIREAEDKIRREREEKERKLREERLRIEESERRAQIEAEAKLEEARIAADARIKASKAPPVRLIAGISATVLVLSGIVIGVVVHRNDEARAEARKRAEAAIRLQQEEKAKLDETQRREREELSRKIQKFQDELGKSTSASDRERIQKQIDAATEQQKRRSSPKRGGTKEPGQPSPPVDDGTLPGM